MLVCSAFAVVPVASAQAASITVTQECIESVTPEPLGGLVSGTFSGAPGAPYDQLSFVSAEDSDPQGVPSNTWLHYGGQSVLVDAEGDGTFSFNLAEDYGSQLPDTLWVTLRLTDGLWTPFATVEVPVCDREPEPEPEPVYDFDGFFEPVENRDAGGSLVLNRVQAGSAVPLKFRLGGDYGLDVFADGYPRSETIACDSQAEVNGIDQTVNAGGSSLQYNTATGTYTYVWKTEKAWEDTCRQLVVKFDDGTTARANFQLK